MDWVSSVSDTTIPRWFRCSFPAAIADIQLHYFSDTSKHGYAAVAYLRFVDNRGRVNCTFIIRKKRHTPWKQWAVPRLELQAAVIFTRLHLMIMDELDLPINSATYWTDSMTVFQYVTNQKRIFKPLIADRVTEIHDASTAEQWRHVPRSLNPADEGLRGTDIHALKSKCCWLFGPKFLLQPEDQWPVKETDKIPDNDKEVEVEKHVTFIARGSALNLLLRRYSSWPKLQTLVRWGRGAEKVYRCLFTCFISRAVHIEDVSSLETDSFT